MGWPAAFSRVDGEQELVDEIVAALLRSRYLEVQDLSSRFSARFNETVRMSPWTPYSESKRNDGSFKRWLKDCGFDVGPNVGNQAWVYAPEDDSWHTYGPSTAAVELGNWGIGDSSIVEIVKKETCQVLQIPRISNGENIHLHCLNLQENRFGDAGVEALVDYILRNRIRMDIFRIFKNFGLGSLGACKLAELYILSERPPPKELHLTRCNVDSHGAAMLLLAVAQRWRFADRIRGKAAKPAYVRLDSNPFSLDEVQAKLQAHNFYIRQGYDPRGRHSDLAEVHENGGPTLIMMPQMSLPKSQKSSRRGDFRSEWYGGASHYEYEEPKPECSPIVVEEHLADPPKDAQGWPLQSGSVVQYFNDASWVGIVVGFDYKGTAVVAWHGGMKTGSRTTAGGKFLRIVEPATGAASSEEAVLPKWEAQKALEREAEARDCDGAPLHKDDSVQYHDDETWVGVLLGFTPEGVCVVDWQKGEKAGKRSLSSGKFLRIARRHQALPSDSAPAARAVHGAAAVIGPHARKVPAVSPLWQGLALSPGVQ